ncbi:hypothetical protein SAMN05421763_11824 [[Luteovulum] sphaeroides subsp. megalophilum]|uniref:hypothetical protein n=1 Tax=Cereibacter sphaeroides TaxID=1063 RepID=UPI000B75E8A7|nr:hypothetical protein [Cereibacter sphaeroides]SNT42710.1 hypothetical protein SAMN05421763_11824 [[Luteovulum] sphaeroides subsp. megalophilum]
MAKAKPYIGDDDEVRELDDHFFAHARRGRPPKPSEQKKVRMNLMIDPELASRLDGMPNKSAFVNEALRKALAS